MDFEREMQRRLDAAMFGTLTTNATPEPMEPLTVDTLRRLALKMPKRETWLSTRLYPARQSALRIEASTENFHVAHPSFWARLEHYCRHDMAPTRRPIGEPALFSGIQIIEIDLRRSDTPERRAWVKGIWDRLKEAIEVASTPLPEWLKSSPSFGEHG